MTTVIHVLGAAIPHHNQTILTFFNDVMSVRQPVSGRRQFLVVSHDADIAMAYPSLAITRYADKKALARAVITRAKDRQVRFFFHGQFNPWLWLALLAGLLHRTQVYWHVWGADLYETATSLKYRLWYLLRRRAQGRVAHLFATCGDIRHYQQRHTGILATRLYFPARMPDKMPERQQQEMFTLLLGNSGDISNRHIAALQTIRRQFGTRIKINIPLGYPENNEAYIARLRTAAAALFPADSVTLITEKIDFASYLQLLASCDLGYFVAGRQQGVGTLCLLIQANIPVVLSRKNPFWRDMVDQALPVLFDSDPLNESLVAEARRQLCLRDKSTIAFFDPAFISGWQRALTIAEGEGQ